MRIKKILLIFMVVILVFSFTACSEKERGKVMPTDEAEEDNAMENKEDADEKEDTQEIEDVDLELPDPIKDGGESTIKVYDIDTESIEDMTVNEYLYGVVAGEVGNDWPEEVLKAQAIIARTFMVNYFVEGDSSKYEGADISTDVSESQAYNKEAINDAIKKAVDDTKGMVITYQNEAIKAFFHSCSGGETATAVEGLEHKEELAYIKKCKI